MNHSLLPGDTSAGSENLKYGVAPVVLLKRLIWVAKEKRVFVEAGSYIGPDRRFKFEGPPAGCEGRRADDLKAPLGDASEPSLSQDEVDAMMRPQRVAL